MTILRSVTACVVLFGTAEGSIGRADEPPAGELHLFLLVGQSNMAGRGTVGDQDREPHPRVWTFTKTGTWEPAVDPLHFDKPGAVGVGLGRTFGIRLAEANPGTHVGLVPCAVGGSPIAAWEPGGYHDQTKSHPYDDTVRRARLALKSGTLKGILWHQGESDATPEKARVYEAKLHGLIGRLRKELDAKDVPFVVGQMGQFPAKPWDAAKKAVDNAHRALPEKVAKSAFVGSDGLTDKGDGVHFDATSYRTFGERYAEAYLALTREAGRPNP